MITLSYSTSTMMQINGVLNKSLRQQQLLHQDHLLLVHLPQDLLPLDLLPQDLLPQDPLPQDQLLVKIGLQPKDARDGSGDQRRPRDATRNFSVKGAGRLVKFVHLDYEFKTKLRSRGKKYNTSNHLHFTMLVECWFIFKVPSRKNNGSNSLVVISASNLKNVTTPLSTHQPFLK